MSEDERHEICLAPTRTRVGRERDIRRHPQPREDREPERGQWGEGGPPTDGSDDDDEAVRRPEGGETDRGRQSRPGAAATTDDGPGSFFGAGSGRALRQSRFVIAPAARRYDKRRDWPGRVLPRGGVPDPGGGGRTRGVPAPREAVRRARGEERKAVVDADRSGLRGGGGTGTRAK